MNHISKTRFPEPLLEYYRTNKQDNKKELGLIFKNNKEVRKEFIAWSASHKSLVGEAPRLFAAETIAKKYNSKTSVPSKVSAIIFGNQATEDIVESHRQNTPVELVQNFSKKNTITALSLYHLKLINEEQFSILFNEKRYYKKFTQNKLCEILSSDRHSPGKKPIFNEKIFTAFLPYLEKLVGKHLLEQLSLEDGNRRTPLFTRNILKSLIPILKARHISLTLLSKQDKEGNTPFHFYDLFEETMPLLNVGVWKFANKTFIDALSKRNNCGDSPLHCADIMETFRPILEYFISRDDFASVYTLLSRKDHYGRTPLHFDDIYIKLIRILQKLSPELNLKLHAIQDGEGNTPLHHDDIMVMAVKFLSPSLFISYAKELFIIQNWKGDTPLHCPLNLKTACPVLMHLKPDVVERVISVENSEGTTVRQVLYDEKIAFPLLNNILFNKLNNYKAPTSKIWTHKMDVHDAYFPIPLLDFFQEEHNYVHTQLKNLFKENEAVKLAFITWATHHDKIVANAPLLCEAKRIAEALNTQKTASSINNLTTLPNHNNRIDSSTHGTLSEENPLKKFSVCNAFSACVLYNKNIIDKNSFIDLFNEKAYVDDQSSSLIDMLAKQKYGDQTLLCRKNVVKASLPFLETQSNNVLQECFSTRDDEGNTPLFYSGVLKNMLPILSRRECFLHLLEQENDAGETVLHKPQLFNILLPFLQNVYIKSDSPAVLTLLSKKDNNGNTPLHFQDNVETAISLLKILNSNDLARLMYIENPQGEIPRNHIYTLNQTSMLDKLFITRPAESRLQALSREIFELHHL